MLAKFIENEHASLDCNLSLHCSINDLWTAIVIVTPKITHFAHWGQGSHDQWRRQRSKGTRSFRGQKILQPGHLDALFPQKSWQPFLVVALKTQVANAASPSK